MADTPIDRFAGEFAFLSNFYPSPVMMGGDTYPTVEHAFQAAKTLDPTSRKKIRMAAAPGQAKRMGRMCSLRADWDAMKVHVMRDLIAQKFAPDTELAKRLIATGNRPLIEGNTWGDRFWGCTDSQNGEYTDWQGLNWLGELLMRQREALTNG